MEDLGHVQLRARAGDGAARTGGAVRIAQLTDLHQFPAAVRRWHVAARGRVVDFDQEGYSSTQNVALVEHVLERQRPDLVVLTGDIIDGRPCAGLARDGFKALFMDVLAPLIRSGTPWLYCPGNHEDDGDACPWNRADLLDVFSLPGCLQCGAKGFDHTLTVGWGASAGGNAVRLWLFDSGANHADPAVRYTTFSPAAVAGYRALSSSRELAPSALGLAFFHIPLPEYEGLVPLVGKNGLFDAGLRGGKVPFPFNYQPFSALVRALGKDLVAGCSRLNSGLFRAMVEHNNVRACFVGHDHHCDWIARREGIYLCYGRVGGFTPPYNWEGAGGALGFDHGARIVEVSPGGKAATWICTFQEDREDEFALD
jgi:hypothetical protein